MWVAVWDVERESGERYNNTSITKLFKEVRMTVPKSKGTRVGWLVTNAMEHPLLHLFDAGPSFHLVAKNNVRCSRGCSITLVATNLPYFFGTVILTSLNNFCNCFYTCLHQFFSLDL